MRALLLFGGLVASAPTAPDTVAMACVGETYRAAVSNGISSEKTFSLPDQIFVFSESSSTVLRAMPRRQEFENVCDIDASGAQIVFSPERIIVDWESSPDWDTRSSCKFLFDRSTGVASYSTQFEWSRSRRSKSEWRMTCSPTPVPIYQKNER